MQNTVCFPGNFPTTYNMALVILLSVPHIQQQIRAVRKRALYNVGGRHWRQSDGLLSILVQIHFSHATDDTMNEPRDSQLHRVRTVRGAQCYRLHLIVPPNRVSEDGVRLHRLSPNRLSGAWGHEKAAWPMRALVGVQ